MIAAEELLQPIAGGNPSGVCLRWEPVYDEIKEARRGDLDLNQGVWKTELKVADFPKVAALAAESLKQRTKDLQIAAWLTEALLITEGFPGLTAGLDLLYGLLDRFWDTVYPAIEEDDDLELRASPLSWLGSTLDMPVESIPLNGAGHGLAIYKASRRWEWRDHWCRTRLIADGHVAPEAFDQAVAETPEAFYIKLETQVTASLDGLEALTELCHTRFGDDGPWFGRLRLALTTIRDLARTLPATRQNPAPPITVSEIPKVVEELLQPIAGENPSGEYLRWEPLYDAIKEARRDDLGLRQGVWKTEPKVADYSQVISLTTDALKQRTKDLQIAAWLTEALLIQDGIAGLTAGLQLLHGLLDRFWDTVYPPVEEGGDLELRAAPLSWVGSKLDLPVRNFPLNREGHGLTAYHTSRFVRYADEYSRQTGIPTRRVADWETKPEVFARAVAETPESFYVHLEGQLVASLSSLEKLTILCDARFGEDGPWLGGLRRALIEVHEVARAVLAGKQNPESEAAVS